MILSEKQLNSIAQDLDMGMICYIHKETKEVIVLPDPDSYDVEMELWQESFDKVEGKEDQYLVLNKMSSRESFKIMERFINEVADEKIPDRLSYALEKRKPFRNFRYELDYHDDVLQQWYKFKEKKQIEWTRTAIKMLSDEEE